MGIKDFIKNAFSRGSSDKARYKEMETEYRMQKTLQERQKSANQRELEGYHKEQREKMIKYELDRWRKRKKNEFWHGNKIYEQRYMFKERNPILKSRNIFVNNRRLF